MSTALRTYSRGATLAGIEDHVNNKQYVPHFDHQGTIQVLTDRTTGAVTDTFAADAWGVQVKREGTSINRQWYVGNAGYYNPRPATLTPYYVRQRWYQQAYGNFLSTTITNSRPRFSYVSNRPTMMTDPARLGSAPRAPGTGPATRRVEIVIDRAFDVHKPKVENDCGGARWDVFWALVPPLGEDEEFDGYIVQEVHINGSVTNCDTETPVDFPDGCHYFEAWRVHKVKNKIIVPQRDDIFKWSGGPSPSRGSWTISGCATLVEGDLPGGWRSWQQNSQPCPGWSAGNLRWTTRMVGDRLGPASLCRTLSVSWDCPCGGGCQCTSCRWSPLLNLKPPCKGRPCK